MKSRSKVYLYAGFAAGVVALAIYLFMSQPDDHKPVAASARPAVVPAHKSDPTDGSLPVVAAKKTVQTPVGPLPPPLSSASTVPSTASVPMQLATNEEKPMNENASPADVSAPSGTSHPAESIATRRMYMAHASLRTPEVANPDSEANRQILQTMVIKALASAPKSSPTTNHKN